jgi:hypothetical protein
LLRPGTIRIHSRQRLRRRRIRTLALQHGGDECLLRPGPIRIHSRQRLRRRSQKRHLPGRRRRRRRRRRTGVLQHGRDERLCVSHQVERDRTANRRGSIVSHDVGKRNEPPRRRHRPGPPPSSPPPPPPPSPASAPPPWRPRPLPPPHPRALPWRPPPWPRPRSSCPHLRGKVAQLCGLVTRGRTEDVHVQPGLGAVSVAATRTGSTANWTNRFGSPSSVHGLRSWRRDGASSHLPNPHPCDSQLSHSRHAVLPAALSACTVRCARTHHVQQGRVGVRGRRVGVVQQRVHELGITRGGRVLLHPPPPAPTPAKRCSDQPA